MDTTDVPFRNEVLDGLFNLFVTTMTTAITFGFQLLQVLFQVVVQAILQNNGINPLGGGLGI